MAIDTQNKRRSVHGYTLNVVAPVPDATIGTADRAHMAWLYAGLTYDSPVVVTWKPWLHKLFNLHHNLPQLS